MKFEIPIWETANLTIDEAASYSGLSTKTIYDITADPECDFVIWIGSRRLIKRKRFEDFLDNAYQL